MSDESPEDLQGETDDDAADDAEKCLVCGDTQFACDHFFASFDLLEASEGELGLGLGGGALYDLTPPLERVLDAIVESALIDARELVPAALSEEQRLPHAVVGRWAASGGWVSECLEIKRDLVRDARSEGNDDEEELRQIAAASQVSWNLEWLTSFVFECGGDLRKVSQEFDRPMMSTEYEIWWALGGCKSLVAEMRRRLDTLVVDLPPE